MPGGGAGEGAEEDDEDVGLVDAPRRHGRLHLALHCQGAEEDTFGRSGDFYN